MMSNVSPFKVDAQIRGMGLVEQAIHENRFPKPPRKLRSLRLSPVREEEVRDQATELGPSQS